MPAESSSHDLETDLVFASTSHRRCDGTTFGLQCNECVAHGAQEIDVADHARWIGLESEVELATAVSSGLDLADRRNEGRFGVDLDSRAVASGTLVSRMRV